MHLGLGLGDIESLQEAQILVEYCKTCKTYIANSELMKRRVKIFKKNAKICSPKIFRIYQYKVQNKILKYL